MAVIIPIVIQAAATALAASTVVTTIAMLGASAAMAAYQRNKAKRKARDDYNKSLQDRLTMVATTDAARSIILGHARNTDGVLFKGVWGPKREANYTLVVALAGHEVDAIETVYFGDEAVDIDGSGYVTSAPYGSARKITESQDATSTGGAQTITLPRVPSRIVSVTRPLTHGSGTIPFTWTPGSANVGVNSTGITGELTVNYQYDQSESYARVYKYTGAPGQNLSAMLATRFGSLITSEHRFEGIACLVVDLRWNDSAFPNGIPAVSATMRGARVYDPRTGVTAWSVNPALCARHIALHPWVGGAAADEVDDASVIAAANACDVSHTYTDSDGVTTTRPMFTCSYVASTEVSPNTHMDELVEAMGGKWGSAGGRLRMRAGAYTAPVAHITDDWLGPGQRQITPGPGQADLINIMVPTIADSAQDRVSTPVAPVRAQAYIDADGMELTQEVTLSVVDFAPQAQHVCAIAMREMRQGMVLTWPVNMRGFALELFDNVTLTSSRYGFSSKPFEVIGWSFNLQGGIQLTLRETGASIYQPDDEFPASDPEPNTSLPKPWLIDAIENLEAFSGADEPQIVQSDGTVISRVRLRYDSIEDESVTGGGRIEVQYRMGGGDWQTQFFDGLAEEVFLVGLTEGEVYLIRARARNALCAGDWSDTIAHTVLGKTDQPGTVTGLTATAVTGGVRIAWNPSPDADRFSTQLRLGSSWGASTLLQDVADPEVSYVWPWPADGTYTILARHVDTSGNESAATATAAITVTAGAISINTGQITPGATTDIIDVTVVSRSILTPSGFGNYVNVCQITYTAPVACKVQITLSCTAKQYTPLGGSGTYGILNTALSFGGTTSDKAMTINPSSSLPDAAGAVSRTFDESLTAGTTRTYYFLCASPALDPAWTADVYNVRMRLEAIKR